MKNLVEKLQSHTERGKLTVTPAVVYGFDELEFSSYRELNKCTELIVNSKLDLITLLHFSQLEAINSNIFFENAGIDLTNVLKDKNDLKAHKDFVDHLKSQISYEKEEGEGKVLDAFEEKRIHKMDFTPYMLERPEHDDKNIPRGEEEQRDYLLQLIDQGFFNIADNYNKWDRKLNELFSKLSLFNHWGGSSIIQYMYRNRTLLESYEQGKLSDTGLKFIVHARIDKLQFRSTDNDIIKFAYMIRLKYPELSRKMIDTANTYIQSLPKAYWDKEYEDNRKMARAQYDIYNG